MRRASLWIGACALVLVGLAGCLSLGRGHGPVDGFAFLSTANPGLSQDVVGAINETVEPKEIYVVVPPGTDVHALVASLSLSEEATITVVSSGNRIVQQNGLTANDFSMPLTYVITVPGQKQPWSYKVSVREADTNARLSTLIFPRDAVLQPAFDAAVRSYTLTVPFASTSVRIEARGQSRFVKSVSVDGVQSPGPVGGAVVEFSGVPERSVSIEALAEDGVTRERYAVDILRAAPDNNALLGSLDVQDTPLQPAFSPLQLGYQVEVPFATSRFAVRARPQSPVAKVSLEIDSVVGARQGGVVALQFTGNPVDSAGALIDFTTGDSIALIVLVTAEDGTAQPYLLYVHRGPPDRNNALAGLSLVATPGAVVPFTPPFSPGRLSYMAIVPYATPMITVIAPPQAETSGAVIEPTGLFDGARGAIPSTGDPRTGAQVQLPPRALRIQLGVAVTAQDGSVRRYAMEIRRAPPDRNSDLGSLSVSTGTLRPAFSPEIAVYSLVLPASADTVKIAASAASTRSQLAVAGQPGAAPGPGQTVTLAVAQGAAAVVTFIVSAEDGSQKAYRLQVTRELPPASSP